MLLQVLNGFIFAFILASGERQQLYQHHVDEALVGLDRESRGVTWTGEGRRRLGALVRESRELVLVGLERG